MDISLQRPEEGALPVTIFEDEYTITTTTPTLL